MFSEMPELFGREFVIGHFLPFLFFAIVLLLFLDVNFITVDSVSVLNKGYSISVLVIVLIAWFGGIFLVAINRTIIRFFEGYHLQFFSKNVLIKKRKEFFDHQTFMKIWYENQSLQGQRAWVEHNMQKAIEVQSELANHFPDDERWILPTRFGNTIRAFEVYSRIMYGIDAIAGWSRLLAVMPSEYRKLIDNAKAYLDFWINICFLSTVFVILGITLIVAYLVTSKFHEVSLTILLISPTLAIFWLSYKMAIQSANEWGAWIKASFDIFLPGVAEKMCIAVPKTRVQEREMWESLTQALMYRDPDALPNRK